MSSKTLKLKINKLTRELKKEKKISDNAGTKAAFKWNIYKAKGNLKKNELNILHQALKKRLLDKSFKFSKKALNKIPFIKSNKKKNSNLYKDTRKNLKKTLKRISLKL